MSDKPLTLHAVAALDIEAAAGKPKRLRIVGYGGGIMRPEGWGDMLIDLAGLELPDSVTILADHKNELGGIVASGVPSIRAGTLDILATVADTPVGAQVLSLLATGVPLQASVGVKPIESKYIRAGEKVVANGRTHEAPAAGLTVIVKGELREISILPAGADKNTSVNIAARTAEKGFAMATEPNPAATATADPAAEERKRIEMVKARKAPGDLEAKAIAGGWSEHQLCDAMLAREYGSRPAAPTIHVRSGGIGDAKPADVLAAAFLLRAGYAPVAEKELGAKVVQAAADLRCRTVLDICAAALRLECRDLPAGDTELIRASFSTMSLPTALGDSAQKVALAAYRDAPGSWRSFANRVSVNNFKDFNLIRVNALGGFERVAQDGRLKHGALTEQVYQVKADTSGKIFGVTRQQIVNDDLGIFWGLALAFGRMAARAVSDELYRLLLSNPSSFFGEANGNFADGAGTALSMTALTTAMKMMRTQTDPHGQPIDLIPKVLVVPPEQEGTQRQLLNSTLIARDTSGGGDQLPQGNPVAGLLSPEVESRLSNAGFPGHSQTGWYIFGGPQDAAANMAFLNGQESPVVETVQPPADMLGLVYRGYLDFGVGLGDPRAAVLMAGA